MFDLPAAPNILDFNVLDFYEDYLGVSWSSCSNWFWSREDVLKWEAKIQYYDEFSLLFDNSTCDVSYCEYYYSAELKDRVWPCSCIACSYSSNAYVSAYCGKSSFSCPMAFQVRATNHVIWRVLDPGSALSGEINRLRNDKKDGCTSLGERHQ